MDGTSADGGGEVGERIFALGVGAGGYKGEVVGELG